MDSQEQKAQCACGARLKDVDKDRYLASLFIKGAQRGALWALYALNYELAKTREVVTETQLGQMRLIWWRDQIKPLCEGAEPPSNEILTALHGAIQAYALPYEAFEQLIYAREFDLEDTPPASLEGLENYARYTHAPLMQLTEKVLGEAAPTDDLAAAYALTGIIRAVPSHAAQRRCYLTADLMAQAGLSEGQLYEGKNLEALPQIIAPIAQSAQEYLDKARPKTKPHKVQKAMTAQYLAQIKSCGYQPCHSRMSYPVLARELRLLISAML